VRLASWIPFLAMLAPSTAALPSAGCLGCTLKGYQNGLTVQAMVPAVSSSTTVYRMEITAEGDTLSERFGVSPDGDFWVCMDDCRLAGERVEIEPAFFAPKQAIAVAVRRRDEPRGPDQLTVRVYRDEVLAAEHMFSPQYDTDEPNGWGCGEHVFGTASFDVP